MLLQHLPDELRYRCVSGVSEEIGPGVTAQHVGGR
jgi:hypothetical protein